MMALWCRVLRDSEAAAVFFVFCKCFLANGLCVFLIFRCCLELERGMTAALVKVIRVPVVKRKCWDLNVGMRWPIATSVETPSIQTGELR